MDDDLGNAVANMLQSRNKLESRRGEDDEVPRGMWETVETGTREVRVGKAKGRSKKKERRKREKKEAEKGKDNGGEESSRGIGDIR